ncbi:Phosphomannose isomerase [Alteracholeplasma palmae J233]|uniref:Phosphohexomutase n=1 Tax=Alteracholeplasma palmae (strain ATCC 49389 / J233) TaxID=1318466 RepID=U4KR90_ALTPJ|nr:type I phosphomannose isomerase catalytic subunit [Alteracholeplasma palmae]CCV63951.1 Phosphomannose isomerase [Alteracholeplasma palmae J233]
MKEILKLDYKRVWRTYTGGKLIDTMHQKKDASDSHYPEEWIMSITEAINPEPTKGEGLSYIPDLNMTLKTYIENNPEETLGKAFYQKYGLTTAVLVKFIDSLERLTLQVHPNKKDARIYFNSEFGKTECWYFLKGRTIENEKPHVYLGFKKGITRAYFKELFDKQDINGMLNALNKIEVNEKDCILIEGGMPHAIGSGCFLVEIQEPTDYTIRVEKYTPSGLKIDEKLIHQGIGYDKMFDLFNYKYMSLSEIKEKYFIKPRRITQKEKEIIGYDTIDYFKLKELNISKNYLSEENIFYGMVIIEGKGIIKSGDSQYTYEQGEQFFIPYQTQTIEIIPEIPSRIFKCFGPK